MLSRHSPSANQHSSELLPLTSPVVPDFQSLGSPPPFLSLSIHPSRQQKTRQNGRTAKRQLSTRSSTSHLSLPSSPAAATGSRSVTGQPCKVGIRYLEDGQSKVSRAGPKAPLQLEDVTERTYDPKLEKACQI
nr:50S ribosomal protein L24 [Ipomoea batatas]